MVLRLLLLCLGCVCSNGFLPSPLPPSLSTVCRSSLHTHYMGRRSFGARPTILVDAKIDFTNFWLRSIANFTACERPTRDPDYVSWSGSLYWNQGDHLVRLSDHWTGQFGVGPIRECRWYLQQERKLPNVNVVAKCDYCKFQMIKKSSMKKRKKWSKRKT
jgi:hypothetical protein